MKQFVLLIAFLLTLTACGANAAPAEDNDTNSEQASVEIRGSEVSDAPAVNVEEKNTLEFSDTFQSLLNTFNAAHEAIPTYDGDYESYVEEHEDPEFYFSKYAYAPESGHVGNDVVLTLEQVTEDMEIYYKGLRIHYACYNYFGGDAAFRAAVDAVIADCAALEVITCGDLRDSLEKNFSFVKDAHFAMGSRRANEFQVPFFFRDVKYQKTEDGYQTIEGRAVTSVDGYEDLNELFKLSLTLDGELVYYPIVLQGCSYREFISEEVLCKTMLTVHYADGTIDTLTAPPYRLDTDTSGEAPVSVRDDTAVPIVTVNRFGFQTGGGVFLNTALDYKDSNILIVDLMDCMGGEIVVVKEWFFHRFDQEVSPNSLFLYLNGPDRYREVLGKEDQFVLSDNILVLLTSKYTASAAEIFSDMAINTENTLIVGENTLGAAISSSGDFTLPNSGMYMRFGNTLNLHSDTGYFEEYRGYLPDIWVPAAEAEEAVMNFIAKNTAVK